MAEIEIAGDEPLANGMHIAVRLRHDFTVIDAPKLLAAARAAYADSHPGTTNLEAEEIVTSAADAIFAILEREGLLGQAAGVALAAQADHGLEPSGWRFQVTVNEPYHLPAEPDCFDRGDVFALPARS
jgi:hypothetical protein